MDNIVQDVVDHCKGEIEEIGGINYFVNRNGVTQVEANMPARISTYTLSQFVGILENFGEKLNVNVFAPNQVSARLRYQDDNGDNRRVALCDFSQVYNPFSSGKYFEQEDFIIELLTKFPDGESRDNLIKLVSSVKAERMQTSDDDGISQVVAKKAGVVLAQIEKVKNFWPLTSYKTFPEVDQPVINYRLRLHQRSEELPSFALYECDGGAWKVNCVNKVRAHLELLTKDLITVNVL